MQLALFRDLVAGILLLGTVFILVAYIGGRRTVRPLAQRVIEQAETRVGSSVGRVFDLPPRLLEVMETWIRSDLVNLDEPAVLDRLVQPLIKELPELSSAIIAADDGREYLLERNDDTWSRRLMPPGRGPRLATWRIWTNSVNEYTDRAGELDYDSSSRPWYIGVTARKQTGDLSPFWTRPYTFFNTPVLGMTVAQSVQAPNGDEFIIGLDVRLESLTVLTQGMTVMQGGVAFAIDEGRVIGLPGVPLYNQGPLDDLNARFEDMQDRLVPNALEALGALSGPILDPVRFRYDERHWWAHAKRLEQANRNIVIGIAIPEATVMGDISRMRFVLAGMIAIVLAIALMRARIVARRFGEPMEALVRATNRIAGGDLSPTPPIHSTISEVASLAKAHEHMRTSLGLLLKLERDMQVAREIQRSTLPTQLPSLSGYEIAAWSDPADETGGDTYDVAPLAIDACGAWRFEEGSRSGALLLLADATGHGVGPALAVMQLRSMLRMIAYDPTRPLEQVALLNRRLCEDLPPERFITAWMAILDAKANTLQSLSAGQAPLVRYIAATDTFETWNADVAPLGIVPDLTMPEREAITMEPGDLFVVVSDGIFEAKSPGDELFGTERTIAAIRAHMDEGAEAIVTGLRAAVEAFTEGRPAGDDRTGVVVMRSPLDGARSPGASDDSRRTRRRSP